VNLDERAFRVDGVLGAATIRGQITIFLDINRLVDMWRMSQAFPQRTLAHSARKRILVVEDTAFFQKLITNCLDHAGYDVVPACHGGEAVTRLAEGLFDLVISDIEMPEMDGLELARHIRRNEKFDALPLLALSSLDGEEHRARSLAAGFDIHEVKFDRGSFVASVQRLLEHGRKWSLASGGSSTV